MQSKLSNLSERISLNLALIIVGVLILAALFGYTYWRINTLSEQLEQSTTQLTEALAETNKLLSRDISNLEQKAVQLSDTLYVAEQEIENTQHSVNVVQTKLGGFEQEVGQISGTVNTLEKLSKTDPELLQKYSKVFFLNEHYVPERLIEIPLDYQYSDTPQEQIHALVWPHLQDLLQAANSINIPLYVKSAYRSFSEQASVKSSYSIIYGAGTANQFSADQGYSEHQLGTTVDFITTGLNGQLDGFEHTKAYTWMRENAHKYGFTLSYPPNNTYYIFEPWHWRYVGIELATSLYNQNKYFYDLEQREIDEYLVNIFE